MGTPQDHRSPHAQMRWFEVENTEPRIIPAYAVCEYTEAEEPDTGRVVIKVRRPTDQGLSNVLVVGHQIIAPLGRGMATFDATYALRSSSGGTPTSGQFWGTEKDEYYLIRHRSGFEVIGDEDEDIGAVFVRRRVTTQWGKALHNWVNDSIPYVCVQRCDDVTGLNAGGSNVKVYLQRHATMDPNVITGDIVAFTQSSDGTFQAAQDYMDGQIGDIILRKLDVGGVDGLRPGWICETELADRFPYGTCDPGDAGLMGGSTTHIHTGGPAYAEFTIDDHTGITTNSGTANIGDHPTHYHQLELEYAQHGVDGYLSTPVDVLVKPASPQCTYGPYDTACSTPVTLTHTDSGHTHTVPDLTHTVNQSYHYHEHDAANHLPPWIRRYFIIRVDNSTATGSAVC